VVPLSRFRVALSPSLFQIYQLAFWYTSLPSSWPLPVCTRTLIPALKFEINEPVDVVCWIPKPPAVQVDPVVAGVLDDDVLLIELRRRIASRRP
jgi:hypothetical protein